MAVLPLELSLAIECVNLDFPAKMADFEITRDQRVEPLTYFPRFKSVDTRRIDTVHSTMSRHAEQRIFEWFGCQYKDSKYFNRIRWATNDINLDTIMPGGPTEVTPLNACAQRPNLVKQNRDTSIIILQFTVS